MANNLYNAIRIAHRSPTAILNLLVESYEKDYTTFATGNNRAPLEEAVKILTGSKLDKALALAIAKGYEAGGLTVGYIGAVTGKYSVQPSETHAKYDGAIEDATSAFRVAMIDSGLFAEKTEATKEEKEKAKIEREAKKEKEAAEQKAAILNAAVVAGEVVRASDVNPVTAYSDFALADLVGDRINAGLFSEDAAESVAIEIANNFPKISLRRAECLIMLDRVDTVSMAILLDSIYKKMDANSFRNMMHNRGFEPVAETAPVAKTAPVAETATAKKAKSKKAATVTA